MFFASLFHDQRYRNPVNINYNLSTPRQFVCVTFQNVPVSLFSRKTFITSFQRQFQSSIMNRWIEEVAQNRPIAEKKTTSRATDSARTNAVLNNSNKSASTLLLLVYVWKYFIFNCFRDLLKYLAAELLCCISIDHWTTFNTLSAKFVFVILRNVTWIVCMLLEIRHSFILHSSLRFVFNSNIFIFPVFAITNESNWSDKYLFVK